MLQYPHFDPVLLHLGPVKIRWYGLMYLIGFAAGWWLALKRAAKPNSGWTSEQVSDLVFYAAFGVLLGGRIGYVVFYDLAKWIHDPLFIFKLWQGGMSFHGGFLGVCVAMWMFSRKTAKHFFSVMDFVAPLVPIGLGVGRLGNFINGELWGRITDVPWAMIYPQAGNVPRHPSELYEFLLEGVVLFILLWWYSSKPRPRMAVSAVFLIGYGSFRLFCEFFRMPDPQLGFIAFGWLTMGQLLTIPMLVFGVALFIYAYNKKRPSLG